MSRSRGGASKAKGKTGERMAKAFLKQHGWLIADSETQGLAGDDVFARDTEGKWWSIEVKNTSGWSPKYLTQAKRQAKERFDAIQQRLKTADGEILYALKCETFRASDYLVMWHPSNCNIEGNAWVAIYKRGNSSQNIFESPFGG